MVSWHSARAYAQWYSNTSNQEWRLPFEMEWEKAA
jgi:formylglycine-generating enzyme required for sulfatase activity